MGILARRGEEVRESLGEFIADDDSMFLGQMTAAGVRVNRAAALSLTTVWRCVDLLASAVAQSPRDIIVKVGGQSFPEFRNRPAWLTQPVPGDPTMTGNDHFMQVALSLLFDGNFFVHVTPSVLDPQMLVVIDPGLVDVKAGPVYVIKDRVGHEVDRLSPMEMLHGTWIRPAGSLRGISPLEALRLSFGAAIATQEHAARFFGQGASLSFGVEVPGALTPEQRKDLGESLRRRYAGLSNSHAIGVLTNGGKFVTGLAPTPEQAQFLGSRAFSVEDVCRPYGVPPAMVGSTEPGAASFASTDNFDRWFKERAVQPLAERIEDQYDRLVSVPETINDPTASAQFRFNLDAIYRVSLLARYQAYGEGVRGGFLKPNEARALEDRPPVGGAGDQLYMQAQMVPLGSVGQAPAAGVPRSVPEVS
jgi:HK97 family phage portal protein